MAPSCIVAVVVMALGLAWNAGASAPPTLQANLLLRPLTPGEIANPLYGLAASTEVSGGQSSVGVGQPAYLDVLINAAIPIANVTNVSLVLTSQPIGSTATLTASPLGTNVPPYNMSDRYSNHGAAVSQVAGRAVLRPDVTGQYTVTATVASSSYGTTNLTLIISGSTYLGVDVCEFCHSGGLVAANEYVPWSKTLHASMFANGINGVDGSHYGQSCIKCHTVGYDTIATNNGGFYAVQQQLGWTFPTNLVPSNWTNMQAHYPTLANLANIQCENCHGPGTEHAYAFGNTNLPNWPRIWVNYQAGECNQCHDSAPTEPVSAQWSISLHAVTTTVPSGPNHEACGRCHTAEGFAYYASTLVGTNLYTTNNADTTYFPITCQACHDPHSLANPHQLRAATNSVLMADGFTIVTNAGFGAFCMNCHRSRNGSVSNSIVQYPQGLQTWAGGSSFGPHDNPASDMIEGVNGWSYGQAIPSSAHRYAVTDTCVGCHMQSIGSKDPRLTLAGGHTMEMSYNVVANGVTNKVCVVDVCVQCHGPMTSFDFPVADYDGNGVIQGVQTEMQNLLNELSQLLPNSGGVVDGKVKTSFSTATTLSQQFLEAAYNYQFVANDGSKGVHNAPYASGLLKASIADLTGNTNGAPLNASQLAYYEWQVQYFGSGSNPNGAANANPSGDGIPNWLKYNLGLSPLIAGASIPGGVVLADGKNLSAPIIDPNATNSIAIYTAAEIVFNTVLGSSYQIQSISQMDDAWQNLGAPIAGTGSPISYVTPTRYNTQQYYRVVTIP